VSEPSASTSATSERSESNSLASLRSFVLFTLARGAAMLAYQMLGVAVGWQVYALTGSALDLGLVGLAQFLPSFLLVLVVGHVADRFDRKRIAQLCVTVEALAVAGLALGSWQEWITEHAIFALIFVIGAARAFQMPTLQALLPGLVPREALPRAVAVAASTGQAASIVGPALGGLIYVAGPAAAYAASVALFVVAGVALQVVRVERRTEAAPAASVESVFAGIRFIREKPALLGAISLDLFAVLLGGATALLPIYARDILQTGPWGLGALRSSTAVGALATAIWLTRRPLTDRVGRKMLISVAVFGLATIVFGVSHYFALSLATLVVMGASDMVSVVIRQSLVQLETPDAMRGRVAAVNSLFIGTSNQLGEFESGVTAAWFGVVPSVVIGGLGTLAVVFAWGKLFPELATIDRLEHPPAKVQVVPASTPVK
jgi:MFS family permease